MSVSPSLISQIERDMVMPSVGTLYAMVNELGLGLDELFLKNTRSADNCRAMPTVDARVGPVQRSNSRDVIRLDDGVRWELLTTAPDPELEFLYVVYDVGAESCGEDSLVRHGGIEYAYIISGRLGVRIGFDAYELRAGDAISFDAQRPHRLWTIGSRPAVAIWAVLNRHGDKRARPRDGNVRTGADAARQRRGKRATNARQTGKGSGADAPTVGSVRRGERSSSRNDDSDRKGSWKW